MAHSPFDQNNIKLSFTPFFEVCAIIAVIADITRPNWCAMRDQPEKFFYRVSRR